MMELQPSEPQINGGTEPLVWKQPVKVKGMRRGSITKQVRSNWISKVEGERDKKFSGDEDVDDGFRDFDSDSPLKEQSLLNSMDNVDFDGDKGHYQRIGGTRVRVSEGRRRKKELEEVEERSEKDKKALEFGMCVSRDSSLLISNSKI
ncbi:hypothetical protein LguiA_013845 [Lonicera macranthoides]